MKSLPIRLTPGQDLRTPSEVPSALLPEREFAREPDAATEFDELVVRAAQEPSLSRRSGQECGKQIK